MPFQSSYPSRRLSEEWQVVTDSSLSRQQRDDRIIAESGARTLDPLSILWDRAASSLPVYRAQPDDQDHENTLATVVFHVSEKSLEWRVYDRAGDTPRFAMTGVLLPVEHLPIE